MKKNIGLAIALLICVTINAQTTFKGIPIGKKMKITPKEVVTLESVNNLLLKNQNNTVKDGSSPFIFGHNFEVNYHLNNSGKWTTLANGDRIWQLKVYSKDALSLNFIFRQFYMPKDAYVNIYSVNNEEYIGAYTAMNNNEANTLGTELLHSDEVIIEYYEPKEVKGKGRLKVSTITHGFLPIEIYAKDLAKDLNDAGDCNIDVNCPLGSGWENERNSVAMIISNGNSLCTGSLVNNTSNDGTPYFLTANHCGTNPTTWVFRFRWESTTPDCATTSPSGTGPTQYESNNGAVLRATNPGSDFMLCELNSAPNPAWEIYYSGWDRTGNIPTEMTGIHHPSGDIKKICRDNNSGSQTIWQSAEVWEVSDWDQGVTEGGSSGSPLFDQNHRIIGQLYGGTAACSGVVDNDDPDFYGRFDISWNGASASERLSDWLDPTNTGVTTLDGHNPLTITNNNDVLASSQTGITSYYCGNATITPTFTFRNNGFNTLTSLNISISVNGNIQNTPWTGSLASGDYETINLASQTLPNGNYDVIIYTTQPNGIVDEDLNNDTILIPVSVKNPGEFISVVGRLDCNGDETNMYIEDLNGNLEWTLPSNSFAGGNLTGETFSFDVCVSEACNRLYIEDTGADGWDDQNNCYAYLLGVSCDVNDINGNTLTSLQDLAFGSTTNMYFCTDGSLTVNESDTEEKINIYPNPFQNSFQIENLDDNSQITVYNTLGQTITAYNANNTLIIQTENWTKGVYIIVIQSEQKRHTAKVIKK